MPIYRGPGGAAPVNNKVTEDFVAAQTVRAEAAADAAEASAAQADSAEQASTDAATRAEQAALSAFQSKTDAEQSQVLANSAKNSAIQSAFEVQEAAATASEQSAIAVDSANTATAAADLAVASRDAAALSEAVSNDNRIQSDQAREDADFYASEAQNSRLAAEAAVTDALSLRNQAQQAASNATTRAEQARQFAEDAAASAASVDAENLARVDIPNTFTGTQTIKKGGLRQSLTVAGSTSNEILASFETISRPDRPPTKVSIVTSKANVLGITTGTNDVLSLGAGSPNDNSSFTEVMRLTPNRNVGIGTENPITKLEVKSTDDIVARFHARDPSVSNDAIMQIKADGINPQLNAFNLRSLSFATNQIERMQLNARGDLMLGTDTPVDSRFIVDQGTRTHGMTITTDEVNAPSIRFRDNVGNTANVGTIVGDRGISIQGGDAKEGIRVSEQGNVGVNTSSPDSPLHVFRQSDSPIRLARFESLLLDGSDRSIFDIEADTVGNAITLRSTGFNSGGFKFLTGNSERMHLTREGYLGIGTTTPLTPLTVAQPDANAQVAVQRDNLNDRGGAFGQFTFLNSDNRAVAGISAVSVSDNDTSALVMYTGLSSSRNNADSTERMRIQHNGDVGIGSSLPTTRLEVSSPNDTVARFLARDPSASTVAALQIKATGIDPQLNALNNRSLCFATNQSEKMRIQPSGNVGIGTTAPQAKLDVAGDAVFSGNITAANLNITTEQGEWTPRLEDTGNNTVSISFREGNYIKVGNLVTVEFWLNTGLINNSPDVTIDDIHDLPFPIAGAGTGFSYAKGTVTVSGLEFQGYVFGAASIGQSSIEIRDHRSGTGNERLRTPTGSNDSYVISGSLTYLTNS